MATYKKRGYKPKTKADRLEALEEQSKTAEVFKSLDEGASKTEQWVIKNQKIIFSIIGAVAVIVLGYLGYTKYIQEPKEIEAKNDMFQAQQYFDQAVNAVEKDSLFTLSLNGGEGKFGMLDIIDNHGSTDAGNLANYYAGMAYFNLKDYENAVRYLGDFKSDDDVLGPLAAGGIGDCFIQLNQPEDALDYYKEAAEMKTNNFSTPIYLHKAGTTALNLDRPAEALKYFQRIKDEFPESSQAGTIDVFIGRAQAAVN
ncbi:MAG: tetratricopeptide repeat protein [Flavobacteriaceae bacterium]|nr:tetratricopeptide repeat protein [Bacteroidia bacterium]NNK87566.1 tetratricopeptide repeat protein [Flavobacteriaceae bacterium]